MKKIISYLSIIGTMLMVISCITSYSPENLNLSINDGDSVTFSATSDIRTADLVWTLDEKVVATGEEYALIGQNTGSEDIILTLIVAEEGGNPLLRHDSVKWTITVAARAIDNDGDDHFAGPDDCDDNDDTIYAGADEICQNGKDDDCDGAIDEAECIVPDPPDPVVGVNATDLGDGRTDVLITWDASERATYYEVYRAAWDQTATMKKVATEVTGNSYNFVQTWDADVFGITGPNPVLPLQPTDDDKKAFIPVLNNYRLQMVEPILFDFKARAFFAVKACNAGGCSVLSESDAGQANFVHTAQESEIAPMVIMIVGDPLLRLLADVPGGTAGANYCGIDMCGYDGYGGPGGIAMGRVELDGLEAVNFDFWYVNYVMGSDYFPYADSIATTSGHLSGYMTLMESTAGKYRVGGDALTIKLYDMDIEFSSRMFFPGDGTVNDGFITVTYNGVSSQYTMPITPAAVQTNPNYLEAIKPSNIYPQRTDEFGYIPTTTAVPTPFTEERQGNCRHNSGRTGYVEVCFTE